MPAAVRVPGRSRADMVGIWSPRATGVAPELVTLYTAALYSPTGGPGPNLPEMSAPCCGHSGGLCSSGAAFAEEFPRLAERVPGCRSDVSARQVRCSVLVEGKPSWLLEPAAPQIRQEAHLYDKLQRRQGHEPVRQRGRRPWRPELKRGIRKCSR